jgi:hypothetical protein
VLIFARWPHFVQAIEVIGAPLRNTLLLPNAANPALGKRAAILGSGGQCRDPARHHLLRRACIRGTRRAVDNGGPIGSATWGLMNGRRCAADTWQHAPHSVCDLVEALCRALDRSLAGFLGYLIPWGQLRFWLAIQIANVFGDAPISVSVATRDAGWHRCHVNSLLARHVGRTFGGFRLVLQRVRQ